ncbi:uncharacterized protein LOC135351255 [Halichondria panicea]|uniref:uncharacterized protein LOC135351255 n=1 Tax=Halichondria panicea TaxID=6063 RepID=UPI00312B82B2
MTDPTDYQELDQEKAMDQSPPETDKQPLIGAEPPRPMLAPEVHLQPRSLAPPGPQQYPPQYEQAPFGTLNASIFKFQAEETRARQTNTTVVVTQPTSVIYQQNVPAWIGSDLLIYLSIFIMLCCGLLPGFVALVFAWEARNKKEIGRIKEAKSWTLAAIVCNVLTALLGVAAIVFVYRCYN